MQLSATDIDQCLKLRSKRPPQATSISVCVGRTIAERPDGPRVRFAPYPTPLFDAAGKFIGAVNLLVDVTERDQVNYLRGQAVRCRRLARSVDGQTASATLRGMAADYEEQAAKMGKPQ